MLLRTSPCASWFISGSGNLFRLAVAFFAGALLAVFFMLLAWHVCLSGSSSKNFKVAHYQKLLTGSATVTESKPLLDRRTGTMREVDVCIESTVGGHPVVVSVECRDHGRPADVSWVEQMKAKHEHLATNALVLVSRSGFTKEASAVAKAEGIQLLSYDAVSEESVRNLFGFGSSLWGATYELSVTKVIAVVPAIGDIPS